VGLQQQLGGGGQQPGPLVQPGQVQQYQTHVFAPIVTGELMKKPKYSVSGSSIGGGGSVGVLAGAGGGAGAGGKSLFVLFRVSLSSFFFFFFSFRMFLQLYVKERTSSVRSLTSGVSSQYPLRNFPFFVPGQRISGASNFVCYPSPGILLFLLFSFVYHSPLTLHLGRFSRFNSLFFSTPRFRLIYTFLAFILPMSFPTSFLYSGFFFTLLPLPFFVLFTL
jgi:hypothetical protein